MPCLTPSSFEMILIEFTLFTSSIIPVSCGGVTCAPSDQYALQPLYCGGLCDAVTTTPVVQPKVRIANESSGVGRSEVNKYTVKPFAAKIHAVSSANTSEYFRESYAMAAESFPAAACSGSALMH